MTHRIAIPHKLHRASIAACVGILLLSACASTPPSNETLVRADAALLRASTELTSTHAQPELRIATDKLARAHAARSAGQDEQATLLAQQVEVDALLAERLALAVQSRKARQESDAAAQALREELARKGPR